MLILAGGNNLRGRAGGSGEACASGAEICGKKQFDVRRAHEHTGR